VLPELSNSGYVFSDAGEALSLASAAASGVTLREWRSLAARHDLTIAGASRRPGTGQEIAAFTSPATFCSTIGLHFLSAYDTGHTSPSSRFAASWKPRVE
jgi:predicted amidohydrolase